MLFMLWLVLTTGLGLIEVHLSIVILSGVLFLLLDLCTIAKVWGVMDRIGTQGTREGF